MHHARQQLDDLKMQLDQQTTRMRVLVGGLSEHFWGWRPPSGGWSIAECIQHLNITSRSYIPLLRAAIDSLREEGPKEPTRYRRDLIAYLLIRSLEPPVRKRYVTPPRFDPAAIEPREKVVAEWERLQDSLEELNDASRGLDLNRATIVSPFNRRVTYNIYSALLILVTHQRRHLWQGEQVASIAQLNR